MDSPKRCENWDAPRRSCSPASLSRAGKIPLEGAAAFPREEIARLPSRWAQGEPLADGTGEPRRVEALIYQHWPMLSEAEPCALPTAVDLAGPHLLERFYWGAHPLPRRASKKNCAPWRGRISRRRGVAGKPRGWRLFSPRRGVAKRFGKTWRASRGSQRERPSAWDSPIFISMTLSSAWSPWPYRDRERPGHRLLRGVLAVAKSGLGDPRDAPFFSMNSARGELLVAGSGLPGVRVGEALESLWREADLHPRVRRVGRTPLDCVASLCQGADAALDLMEPNPERLLATPTRSAMYRALGVPVLYNNYSEASPLFRGGADGSGWAIPWEDAGALRAALEEIASKTGGSGSIEQRPSEADAAEFSTERARIAAESLADWLARIESGALPPKRATSNKKSAALESAEAREIAREASETLDLPERACEAIGEGLSWVLEARRPAAWASQAPAIPALRLDSRGKRVARRLAAFSLAPAAALGAGVAALVLALPSKRES
jgi:hypothetical protein